MVLDLSINPDIIAGLVIKMGDNVIDMSLKHKLEDLSKSIGKKNKAILGILDENLAKEIKKIIDGGEAIG